MKFSAFSPATRRTSRAGFTLVEILVALGIMLLLLTVIFVPLRLGFDSFHVGNARAQVQQANKATVNQIEDEIRRAIYIYPNAELPGVTDKAPYTNNNGMPYTKSKGASDKSQASDSPPYTSQYRICSGSTNVMPWNNQSRIDFLLPKTDNGSVVNPLEPAYYLVTYYPRRLDITKLYDDVDNPIVLFRAQIPYKNDDGSDFKNPAPTLNAQLGPERYPDSTSCGSNAAKLNRDSLWLAHNVYGEANLEPLTDTDAAGGVVGSHVLATPRGMGLVAPNVYADPTPSYQPDTSFICEDSDGDGKIDRVTINLALAQFDQGNAATRNGKPNAQSIRYSQTVDLPNIQ